MSGRQENDAKNREKLNRMVGEKPLILRNYLDNIANDKTTNTQIVYMYYIFQFCDWMESEKGLSQWNTYSYDQILPMDIDKYIKFIRFRKQKDGTVKQNKYSIINANIAAVNSFFEFLLENHIVKENPCIGKKAPKDAEIHDVVYMTEEDIRKMIKAISDNEDYDIIMRDLAIFELGCKTGLRVSAIVNIDISDIDFKNMTITVIEKGNIKKKVYVGEKTMEAITDWIKYRNSCETDALFVNSRGSRMKVLHVQKMIRDYANKAGLDKKITPHKMRATCATNLYEATGDIYLVQQQLGHKNISNTMKYARVSDKKRREATDILDNLF